MSYHIPKKYVLPHAQQIYSTCRDTNALLFEYESEIDTLIHAVQEGTKQTKPEPLNVGKVIKATSLSLQSQNN